MEHDGALDNPVWAALTGPQSALGTVQGGAARFDPEVTPFAAVRDAAEPDDWRDLRGLVRDGEVVVIPGMRRSDVPGEWAVLEEFPCYQMVLGRPGRRPSAPTAEIRSLGPDDVPDMLALVAATEPGPFLPRTVETGPYLGIWSPDEARTLAAMSGVRLRTGRWSEISAVCTDPRFRGRGYAGMLIERLLESAVSKDASTFLHVRIGNPAQRVYEALGFTVRRDFDFLVLRATDGSRR